MSRCVDKKQTNKQTNKKRNKRHVFQYLQTGKVGLITLHNISVID